MSGNRTIDYRSRKARALVNAHRQDPQGTGNSILDFIDSVASSVKDLVANPIKRFAKAVVAHASILEWLLPIQVHATIALAVWVYNDIKRKIEAMILQQVDKLRAWTFAQLKDVYYVLAVAITALRAQLTMLLRAETRARVRAVARAEAEARRDIRVLHLAIEHEARSGYKSGEPAHLSAITILGDAIVAAEPAVKHLVSRIVGYAIDLAEVDNPILRFIAGKLISYLIGKLGISKIAGEMLGGLVLPVSHLNAPRGLPEVVTAICGRIGKLEQFNATFMADGGPEILRAGKEWRNIDSPATAVALAAFFGGMVAAPNQWAEAISGTIGAVVDDTITAVAKVMRG